MLAAAERRPRRARRAYDPRCRRPQALAQLPPHHDEVGGEAIYQQAQAAIDGRTDDTTGPLLKPVLEPLWAAYEARKRERAERQPLDLDLPERKILLKSDGTVDRVIVPERQDANKLIEEFMILANVATAETLEKARVPLIYRVPRRAFDREAQFAA